VHDAAFVVFALALFLALLALGLRMRRDAAWRRHQRYTLATAVVCAACLFLPGVAYYGFLAAALVLIEATALKVLARGRPAG
jgi:4-amino-4-deoxy-L-arabinose transferase-like glycosyltransferase